ncbi:MAG: hypothetical protein BGO66_17645 [Alicycliphilus sp. 69-12]|nr:MAG: hypothetical protein BGO66_17645 [Alicycliphilus sp. 69-12]
MASHRGLAVSVVKGTEAGVFFGAKAVELGLADRIEPPQAAINRIAAQVAGNRKPKPVQRIGARAAAMDLRSRT